jgi:hypothetical protein
MARVTAAAGIGAMVWDSAAGEVTPYLLGETSRLASGTQQQTTLGGAVKIGDRSDDTFGTSEQPLHQ